MNNIPKIDKEILDFLNFDLALRGPLTAEEDENGVVHLKNSKGYTVLMMSKQDYQDFLNYKTNKNGR